MKARIISIAGNTVTAEIINAYTGKSCGNVTVPIDDYGFVIQSEDEYPDWGNDKINDYIHECGESARFEAVEDANTEIVHAILDEWRRRTDPSEVA